MGKEKKEFSLSRKITCDEALQNLFKSSFSFFDAYDGSNEENYGGGSRRKKLYSCRHMILFQRRYDVVFLQG